MRILFIGNSQMRYCNVPALVRELAESAPEEAPRLVCSEVVSGGKTLQLHWDAGDGPGTPRGTIAEGNWDRVVVQEIYSAPREQFEAYAGRFQEAIHAAGSTTVLFATASVTGHYSQQYSYPESTRGLNEMQLAYGRRRGVQVAAAGLAWIRYLGPSPSEAQVLDLYAQDRGHPGPKGSYIYACLLYAALTGCTPVGLSPRVNDLVLDSDEAAGMQRAAWEEYRATGCE